MRIYCISGSREMLAGLRLAGVCGVHVETKEEFIEAVQIAGADEGIGIIAVTDDLGKKYPGVVCELRQESTVLIVEIPDAPRRRHEI